MKNQETKFLGFFCGISFDNYIKKIDIMNFEKEIPFFLNALKNTIVGYSLKRDMIIMEVPGFTKSDIKITLDNYVMHVTGKKEILGETLEVDRKLVLPAGSLNSGEPITAKVENGLLFINLKNSQKTKQTVVDIS